MYSYTIYMYLLLFFILCGPASSRPPQGQRRPQGDSENFYSEVMKTWENIALKFQIEHCLDDAKEKIEKVNTHNHDDYAAKVSISMYSRICKINDNLFTEDKQIVNFPMRLNKELRCEGMSRLRNIQVRQLFQQAGNNINKALDKLRPRHFRNLYRGVETFLYQDKSQFIEFGFFSASTSIKVALGFARGKILLIVEKMRGVYIADYAQDRFAYQKEVLAKRNTMFLINKKETEKDSIKEKVDRLYPKRDRSYPEVIFYISEVVNPNPYNVQSVSLDQKNESYNYCRPS